MATWKANEINILTNHIEQHRGVLDREAILEIQQLLPGRSAAAIKKKYQQKKQNLQETGQMKKQND